MSRRPKSKKAGGSKRSRRRVSDFVVRRLLRERGYSLQANVKTAEGAQHADRDAQFEYLNDQAKLKPTWRAGTR